MKWYKLAQLLTLTNSLNPELLVVLVNLEAKSLRGAQFNTKNHQLNRPDGSNERRFKARPPRKVVFPSKDSKISRQQ